MNMFLKNKKTISIACVVVLCIVVGAFLITQKNTPDTPVLVGVVLPLSGQTAFIGEDLKQGMELAAHDWPDVTFVFEDTAGTIDGMVSAYQKVLLEKPTIIIAAGTGVEAIVPLAEEYEVPTFITVSSASGLPTQGKYVFRYFTNADVDAPIMARYAVETLQLKNVAILHSNDQFGGDYSKVFTESLRQSGVNVLVTESFGYDSFDYRSQLLKIKQSDAEAVYLVGLDFQLVPMLKQIQELGLDSTILSVGTIATGAAIEQAGPSIEGVYVTAFCTDGTPAEYSVRFSDVYGRVPGFFSELGFDMVQMLQLVVTTEGSSVNDVKRGLLDIEDFSGNVGSISSDADGEMVIPMCAKQIVGGKILNLVTGKYSAY